jgi:hypothetical protein
MNSVKLVRERVRFARCWRRPSPSSLWPPRRRRVVALDPDRWEVVVAGDHPRPMAGTGVDVVIRARRRS